MSDIPKEDYARQIAKAIDVLGSVNKMMEGEAQMNAAKHMSGRVLPNPLASAVGALATDLEQFLARHNQGGGV